jgi:hypothetical protein
MSYGFGRLTAAAQEIARQGCWTSSVVFAPAASARAAHLKKAFIDLSLQLLWIEEGRQAEYDRLTALPLVGRTFGEIVR